jgi:hypothetical protein
MAGSVQRQEVRGGVEIVGPARLTPLPALTPLHPRPLAGGHLQPRRMLMSWPFGESGLSVPAEQVSIDASRYLAEGTVLWWRRLPWSPIGATARQVPLHEGGAITVLEATRSGSTWSLRRDSEGSRDVVAVAIRLGTLARVADWIDHESVMAGTGPLSALCLTGHDGVPIGVRAVCWSETL